MCESFIYPRLISPNRGTQIDVSRAQSDHATNVVGAFALVAADEIRQATAQAAGHTDAAPAALTSLYEAPRGRSVDELRRVVGLTPSGGVRLVDRLVADGYVDRRAGADRRNVIVALTPRGRRAARAVRGARAEAIEQLLRPLTASERTQLSKLMGKLLGRAPSNAWPNASRVSRRPAAGCVASATSPPAGATVVHAPPPRPLPPPRAGKECRSTPRRALATHRVSARARAAASTLPIRLPCGPSGH